MMRLTIDDALRLGDILFRAAQAEIMPRFGRLIAGEGGLAASLQTAVRSLTFRLIREGVPMASLRESLDNPPCG